MTDVPGTAAAGSASSGERRSAPVAALAAGTFLVAMVIFLLTSAITTLAGGWRPQFAPVEQNYSPKVRSSVERDLRADGVQVSPAVHRLLGPLLTAWETRDDLRQQFSDDRGRPDVPALLDWAERLPDSFSSAIVADLGAIIELRSRLGILGTDQQILPVLYWTLQNRERTFSDLDAIITRMADVWRERPEIRGRFTADNRVDVRGFLQWINTLAPSDPRFGEFYWQYFEIRQAIVELDRMQGRARD